MCFFSSLSIFIFAVTSCQVGWAQRYTPDWDSLDSRPLPSWYDDVKVGIFIHWGVFSVPSFGSEWFWMNWKSNSSEYVDFMENNYKPGFKYQDFAPGFTAEFFNPDQWSDIFEASGARYIVLNSKHHEGFTLWPSKYSWNWNSADVGPGRDLVGDLANSIRKKHPHVHFGVYHSLYDWFHPLYLQDKESGFVTNNFVTGKTMAELYELVNHYHPEVIWSDGDWEADENYWGSKEFLAWLFNDSPVKDTVVVNDRWGKGVPCHHGSFYNCQDRYNPGVLQLHKWENAMTLDKKSWGYRRNASARDYLTIHEVLKTVAETVSCGGNILINVGPSHDGRIPPIMEERLRELGMWLKVNGEAIYKTVPWKHQNDSYTEDIWFTQRKENESSIVYAIVLNWPTCDDTLVLGSVLSTFSTKISMIGYASPLKFKKNSDGLEIAFPTMSEVQSNWAWVLKMKDIQAKL